MTEDSTGKSPSILEQLEVTSPSQQADSAQGEALSEAQRQAVAEAEAQVKSLPTLLQGDLDPEHLQALLTDYSNYAQISEVLVKTGALDRAQAERPTLEQAVELLVAGRAFAIQVRYQHDGQWWCDVISKRSGGARLVRMAFEPDPGSAKPGPQPAPQ